VIVHVQGVAGARITPTHPKENHMYYKFRVIERYPDGTKWTHYFETKTAAQTAIDDLSRPDKRRTYELIES
jgi:hypothetical protein